MEKKQNNTGENKMRQDSVEQIIREELEREGRMLQKEVEASEIEDLSESKQQEIWAKVQKRIADREMEASAELTDMDVFDKLSEEDREALELGRKVKEERKHAHQRRTRKMYVALAAAMILVLAIGMTSVGGPERIVSVVKQMIGGREVTKINSDENNLILEKEDEEKAYQKIEEEFEVEIIRLRKVVEDMRFNQMNLDETMQVAELLYHYGEKNLLYIISADYNESSMGIDMEDKIIEREEIYNSGNKIELTIYEVEENFSERCMAKFDYHGVKYFLIGTLPKEEFKIILENLYFS